MSMNYDLIRQAIIDGRQVTFTYQGYRREACPHVIGYKNGMEKALVFQFGGGSSSGLPIGGQWRCVFLSEVLDVKIAQGDWHTGNSHTRPQTCVDQIDVQVQIGADGKPTPYLKRAYS